LIFWSDNKEEPMRSLSQRPQPGYPGTSVGFLRQAFLPCVVLLAAAAPARQPLPLALVLGEGAYTAATPRPACTQSTRAVAASLRHRGFVVTESEDASNGALSAVIGDIATQLDARPGSTLLVYACAYAAALDGRVFLLPVESILQRDTDILTEGILARSLQMLPVRAGAASSLVVLDTAAWPLAGTGQPLDWNAMRAQPAASGEAWIAATDAETSDDAPTRVAKMLLTAITTPDPDAETIAADMRERLAGQERVAVVTQLGSGPAPLLPRALPEAPSPTMSANIPAPAAQVALSPAPAPPTYPEEEATSPDQRKAVQAALSRLGYYDGHLDGIYGPDTRAAIRRYQHEIGQAMTGLLTSDQATRLIHSNH
jgi:putative peptidoglycan binding protein